LADCLLALESGLADAETASSRVNKAFPSISQA